MLTNPKMAKAKASLIMTQPFFASLLCQMPMIEDATLNPPTMATDMKSIWFHPDFVEKSSQDELKFVLCHEIGHTIFQHGWRRGSRNARKWNIAGDFIINNLLLTEQPPVGTMPAGGLNDPALVAAGGGTTDGVYNLLPDTDGDGGGGSGSGQGPLDECRDAPGGAADREADEAQMKVRIAQAAQAARMCGKLSANMQRLVDGALEPKVAWQDVLRRFISARAKVERSFARPKRRFIGEDVYLPSLSGERLGKIVVAVDCSGSIGPRELNEFAAEIKGIWEDTHPEQLDVVYFDSRVSHHDTFMPDDEVHIEGHGGGGTAFSPIFRHIDLMDIEPAACVVLTDLCCSDFGPAPAYPTLWVSNHSSAAPWGEVVMMNQNL